MSAEIVRIGISGAQSYRQEIQPLVTTADTCLPLEKDKPTLVNHTGEQDPSYYSESFGFLHNAQAPRKLVETVIDRWSRWKYEPSNDFRPFRKTRIYQLHNQLERVMGPIIELGNWSLRKAQYGGVNDHSVKHIRKVAYETVSFLSDAGCDYEMQEDGAYAAWGHDGGNIFGKGPHGRIGVEIIKRVIPAITSNPERWKRIRRAIALHDSSFLSPLVAEIEKRKSGYEAKIESVGHYMGKVGAALYIADKLHVNEDRILLDPTWGSPTKQVESDLHKLVNTQLGTQANTGLAEDGTVFSWNLQLDPYVSSDNYHNLKLILQKADLRDKRLKLVGALSSEINDNPKDALEKAAQDFHSIYPTRLTEMPLVVFSLFPNVERFQIVFSAENDKGLYKRQLIYSVDRKTGKITYPEGMEPQAAVA